MIAGLVLPRGVQALVVQPNELASRTVLHRKKYSIDAGRAFDLDSVETKTFQPRADLSPTRLQANDSTLRNIRLWDTRPLLEANRQLQRIRLYYEFPSADVDIAITLKTTLATSFGSRSDCEPKIRALARSPVLKKGRFWWAARELDYGNVPPEAQTWINQRLIYTHGYGFTLSPVNTAESSGLPTYFIKDIGAGNDDGTLQTATPDIAASIPH